MDRGVDRGYHERLQRLRLGRVFDAVVVGEGLRGDPVVRRDGENRLPRRHRVDLQTRWVLAKGRNRRATGDQDRSLRRFRTRACHDRWLRLRKSKRAEMLELRRGDDGPYRDHRGDDAAGRGHDRRGPSTDRAPLVTAPAWLAEDDTKRDIR